MALRASWKGFLKLSLVSCPVRMYSALNRGEQISFRMLHKDTKNRIQLKPYDTELGLVERSDTVNGYEFEKDKYVIVTEEDLESVKIESTKTISIEKFVDVAEIDPVYMDTPYYLTPDGPVAKETFQVIHDAMTTKGKAALARVVLSGRERLVAMTALEGGLKLTTLRTAADVKNYKEVFDGLGDEEIDSDLLNMAEMIIDQFSGEFEPSEYEDRYQVALLEMVKAKIKGTEPVVAKSPEAGNVINLMDALKRSVEETGQKKPPAKSKRKTAAESKTTKSRSKSA